MKPEAGSPVNTMNKHKRYVKCRFLVVLLLSFGGVVTAFAQSADPVIPAAELPETKNDYQYFDLNCNVDPWGGYFAPARWHCNVRKNDALADVSSADQHDAYGESPLVVVGRHAEVMESWSIEIPAPGYLSFRLKPAEMANLEALRVSVNDRAVGFKLRSDGLYYSPYLRTGDRFVLHIPAGKTTYHWTNLLFHTNYSSVIVRPGEADPRRRYAPIEADLIQRVFFPSDRPGQWPVFDLDGDPETQEDQLELRSTNERFSVQYKDELGADDAGFYLQRTFTIQEKCSRGNRMLRSRRWVSLPLIVE